MALKAKFILLVVSVLGVIFWGTMASTTLDSKSVKSNSYDLYSKIREFNIAEDRYTFEGHNDYLRELKHEELACCPLDKKKEKKETVVVKKSSAKEKIISKALELVGVDKDMLKLGKNAKIYVKVSKISKLGVKYKF